MKSPAARASSFDQSDARGGLPELSFIWAEPPCRPPFWGVTKDDADLSSTATSKDGSFHPYHSTSVSLAAEFSSLRTVPCTPLYRRPLDAPYSLISLLAWKFAFGSKMSGSPSRPQGDAGDGQPQQQQSRVGAVTAPRTEQELAQVSTVPPFCPRHNGDPHACYLLSKFPRMRKMTEKQKMRKLNC